MVWKQARASASFGIELNDAYASIAAFGNKLWFGDIQAMRKHNDGGDNLIWIGKIEIITIVIVLAHDITERDGERTSVYQKSTIQLLNACGVEKIFSV